MKNPLKRKSVQMWLKALRSRKYKQGRGFLKKTWQNEDRFCCLGVACDLYNKYAKQNKKKSLTFIKQKTNVYSIDTEQASLPSIVKNWLGLENSFGDYCNNSLAYQNDKGLSFNKIADIIESCPEGLFVK